MSQVPELREEINRKAFDTLEWLLSSQRAGNLTDVQLHTGVHAVWNTVSGLVTDSVGELISTATAVCAEAAAWEKRHFVKEGTLVTVAHQAGESAFEARVRQGVSKRIEVKKYDNPREAKDAMNRWCLALLSYGYEEL